MTRIRRERRSGDVIALTLDNAAQRNALDEEWWTELGDVLDELEAEPQPRVVTITGAGTAFSAGGDLVRMRASLDAMDAGAFEEAERTRMDRNGRLLCRWVTLPALRIAALNGPAVGAGLSLACSCDHRIMAEGASLDSGFSRIGLPGDLGATYFLPRLIGRHRAAAWLLRSRRVGAAEALRLGLVDEVVPDDRLGVELDRAAADFLSVSPQAARHLRAWEHSIPELVRALEDEREATIACKQSAFHRSAVLSTAGAGPLKTPAATRNA